MLKGSEKQRGEPKKERHKDFIEEVQDGKSDDKDA